MPQLVFSTTYILDLCLQSPRCNTRRNRQQCNLTFINFVYTSAGLLQFLHPHSVITWIHVCNVRNARRVVAGSIATLPPLTLCTSTDLQYLVSYFYYLDSCLQSPRCNMSLTRKHCSLTSSRQTSRIEA